MLQRNSEMIAKLSDPRDSDQKMRFQNSEYVASKIEFTNIIRMINVEEQFIYHGKIEWFKRIGQGNVTPDL